VGAGRQVQAGDEGGAPAWILPEAEERGPALVVAGDRPEECGCRDHRAPPPMPAQLDATKPRRARERFARLGPSAESQRGLWDGAAPAGISCIT